MKHSKKLIRSLLGLIVLLASCQVDDSPSILSDSEAQLFVSEARDYYEQTISEAVEKNKLVQNKNMSPGEVTPCWHKAHIKQDANYEYVYVPIIAGNNYIRRVKIGKQGEKKNYRIPISQTLCVRRDKMSNYDAAYVTIMPSLNYYRANKSTFSEKVIQDKSLYGNLSGYVVYNNIVTSKMIVADRVKSGKCLWSYSPTTLKDKALSRKIKKEIFQNIHNIGMSLTRNTIDGGMLEEVEITPEKCPICGENDSDDHFCPTEEWPEEEEEEEEEGDNYFPGGWGGGGGLPSGGGNDSKPTNIAPKAKAIFRNSNMTDTNWAVIERMLDKIMEDCMGGSLYNGLKESLNGKTLTIQFIDNGNSAFNLDGGIRLRTDAVSGDFLHEMLHAYQAYRESYTSMSNAKLNMEIETHYAQYIYQRALPEYKNSEWEKRDKTKARWNEISRLSMYIDSKGNLNSNANISEFEFRILNYVIPALRQAGYSSDKYTLDYDRLGLENFKNIRELTKNC